MRQVLALAWTTTCAVAFTPTAGLSIRSIGQQHARVTPVILQAGKNPRDSFFANVERKAKPLLVPALSYTGLVCTAVGAQQLVAASTVGHAAVFGIPLPLATIAAIAAPALWLLSEFAMFGGGQSVAKMMGGQPADAALITLCARVAERAGLPPPAHVYEIPTAELNAFAAGFGSGDATVAVTSGIRRALSSRELEAVIAHELGHIRHSDMSTNMHVAVAIAGLGGLYEMGNALLRSERSRDSDESESSLASLGLALVVGGAATRLIAQMLQLSMSRGAEYEADRVAADLCGADSMIAALTKIEKASSRAPRDRLASRGDTFAHAYISNGPSETGSSEFWPRVKRLFSTHPATHDRIEALRGHAQREALRARRDAKGR